VGQTESATNAANSLPVHYLRKNAPSSASLANRLPFSAASTHMLRIERVDEGSDVTFRATGRLTGPWVAEFERALSDHLTDAPLLIDLTDVSFVDRAGIALLRTLRTRTQVTLRCSAFVAEQIT
jgi:hypothetical protein